MFWARAYIELKLHNLERCKNSTLLEGKAKSIQLDQHKMSIWYNQIYDLFEGKYVVSYKVYYGVLLRGGQLWS